MRYVIGRIRDNPPDLCHLRSISTLLTEIDEPPDPRYNIDSIALVAELAYAVG